MAEVDRGDLPWIIGVIVVIFVVAVVCFGWVQDYADDFCAERGARAVQTGGRGLTYICVTPDGRMLPEQP